MLKLNDSLPCNCETLSLKGAPANTVHLMKVHQHAHQYKALLLPTNTLPTNIIPKFVKSKVGPFSITLPGERSEKRQLLVIRGTATVSLHAPQRWAPRLE